MRLLIALALAAATTACVDDGRPYYVSQVETIFVGDASTTRLQVSASTVSGGHGDHEVTPRTGSTISGGPVPGALVALPEVQPGVYQVDLAAPADAYAVELEGEHYEHAAARLTAAAATADGAGGLEVTFTPRSDPTTVGRTTIRVIAPDGSVPSCDPTLATDNEDHLALDACLFSRPGRYRLEVVRAVQGVGGGATDDAYARAERRTTRVLFHDVP